MILTMVTVFVSSSYNSYYCWYLWMRKIHASIITVAVDKSTIGAQVPHIFRIL